jgi:2-polyprenyl-6-methoxyphenol hydroxylase-like FAD-dependent oxidoreductase
MARAGYDVLVLEREVRFKDRVRGENMLPWGVAAARRLGILDDLVAAGGHQPPWFNQYSAGNLVSRREFPATTPGGESSLNIYHPDLQETLLLRAVRAGAKVKRGATVIGVTPGDPPSVTFEVDGKRDTQTARVVVGADGRASQVRAWGGFEAKRDPELLTIAGTLMEGTAIPEDSIHLAFNAGIATFLAPLGGGRARTYFVYPGVAGRKGLSGKDKIREFVQLILETGVPEAWFASAQSIGPLAEFEGADRWVESPAKNGVALIGDAAASTDPSWGCGLSLSVTDVEHLSTALRGTPDWTAALARYAEEHDDYYGALHRVLGWMTELVWSSGPEADDRRARVFPRMLADPRGFPDAAGLGPFGPNDETARRLILGLN